MSQRRVYQYTAQSCPARQPCGGGVAYPAVASMRVHCAALALLFSRPTVQLQRLSRLYLQPIPALPLASGWPTPSASQLLATSPVACALTLLLFSCSVKFLRDVEHNPIAQRPSIVRHHVAHLHALSSGATVSWVYFFPADSAVPPGLFSGAPHRRTVTMATTVVDCSYRPSAVSVHISIAADE